MTELETRAIVQRNKWVVLAAIITLRTVYALNWYNFGPALVQIGSELNIGLVGQGVLTSSFLLGAGIFQVPGGALATRWGNKNTSQLGMLILSLSGIAEGLSPTFTILYLSRFVLGIGAALFFSPAIGVLTPLFREEEHGLVIGFYNAAFSIGGGLGLSVWALIIQASGWRPALILGGAIGLALVVLGQFVVPRDRIRTLPSGTSQSMGKAFRSRNIWVISIGVLGLWGGVFTGAQFLNGYLEKSLNVQPDIAAALSSTLLFASTVGGPVAGYLSDKFRKRKIFILVPGLIASVFLGLIGLLPVGGLWLVLPTIGFFDAMVFSIMYASPSQFPEVGPRYAPFAISVMNSAHILGSFLIPIGYGVTVASFGYNAGWYFLGALAVIMMVAILKLDEPFRANSKRPI